MNSRIANSYEEVAYEALREACHPNGARVFRTVPVADVLLRGGAGTATRRFGGGGRSHFDFVVTTNDRDPLFSVEFDGPPHRIGEVQRDLDRLTNELCEQCGHSLLRINSSHLTKTYRGLDLLTYFVEAWFLGTAFDEAQRQGLIPEDEGFDMTFVYSTGKSQERSWPYWLSHDVQVALEKLHQVGSTGQMAASNVVGVDQEGNHRCLSWLVLDSDHVIATRTGMRAQRFAMVDECDLVGMLATFDILPKVNAALQGDRTQLLDRRAFFSESLPAFKERYETRSEISFGATV